MEEKIRNIFVSHYHGDDEHVDKLAKLLAGRDFQIRNSSLRSNDDTQVWADTVKDETIRNRLRDQISWAGAVVVLIGKKTAERDWIDWEIEEAHRQGKPIVGVFTQGATDADLPENFQKYGTSLVGWIAEKVIAAIEGNENNFENPDGTPKSNNFSPKIKC